MVILKTDDPVPLLNSLTGWAIGHGLALERLEVTRPSLEETYLELIARDEAQRGKA
jgi:ABC-2 type transport system ATP-binding protein